MENSNGEPQSFFEAPVTTPERSHYDRFTRRDEKIADINATLASKTRIIPEQQRTIMENALTKHWVPLTDDDDVFVDEKGEGTPVNPSSTNKTAVAEVSETVEGSPYPFLEAEEIENPDTHSYEYYVVQGKREREQLRDAVSRYLADPGEANLRQVRLGIQSLNQLSTMEVDDPKAAAMFDLLTSEYTGLAHDVELLLDPDHKVNPEQFWRWFNRDLEKIEKNIDSSVAPFYKQWLRDDDGLDGVDDRLKGLTEKFPDTALTDKTIDQFIQAHLIDPSGLVKAFEDYKKDPSEQNKDALMLSIGEIKEQHEELDNLLKQTRFRKSQELTGPFKQGIDYSKGSEKYEGFKDFNQDIKTLITYSLEITGFEKSTARPDLYGNDLYRDEVFIDMYVDWMRAKGVAPEEYKSPADAIDIFYTRAELEADQLARKKAAGIVEKKILPPPTTFDTAKEVLVLEGNEVDQFVTDHFVDVSPLLTEYQTYREALNVLTALKQARNKGNQSITDDQVAEAENSAKQIVKRFEPIVEDIDEQLSEKGIDKSVTLQARRESPGVRDAQKLMTILSYQKQVSDLLNLVDEAAGKKTARNGQAIRRSDDEVQELFSNINENLSRIKSIEKGEQSPTAITTESPLDQENNQENPRVLQPENAVILPPESVALKGTIQSITEKINIINRKVVVSAADGTKNGIDAEIAELNSLIDSLKGIEKPPVPVDYLVSQVEDFIDKAHVLQNTTPENPVAAQREYLASEDYLKSARDFVLRQEYEKEIELAIKQSTPEAKRTVPISVEDFRTLSYDLLSNYTKNIKYDYLFTNIFNEFDRNNLRVRQSELKALLDTVIVTDDIPDLDDDFHTWAHSYVTAVKGLFRLASENQEKPELYTDQAKRDEFLANLDVQKRRVDSLMFQ